MRSISPALLTPDPPVGEHAEQASAVPGRAGLFRLGNEAQATVLQFAKGGWVGRDEALGAPLYPRDPLHPESPYKLSLPPSRVVTGGSLEAF